MNKWRDNIVNKTQSVLESILTNLILSGIFINESGFNPHWDERFWLISRSGMKVCFDVAFRL